APARRLTRVGARNLEIEGRIDVSESSESLQLFRQGIEGAQRLLLSCNAPGVIGRSNDRWVSCVLLAPSLEADVINRSEGILARYHFDSDYGLLLNFFRDGEPIGDLVVRSNPNDVHCSDCLTSTLIAAQVLDPDQISSLMRVLERHRT